MGNPPTLTGIEGGAPQYTGRDMVTELFEVARDGALRLPLDDPYRETAVTIATSLGLMLGRDRLHAV